MSRPFQFFDREAVDSAVLPNLQVTCSAGGKGKLVFGDHEGTIHILDASWTLETSFRAHDLAVSHLKQVSRTVLVSIGNDTRHEATVKFWDVGKKDRNGRPINLKTLEPVLKGEKGAPCGVPLRLNLNPDLPIIFHGTGEDEGYTGGRRPPVDGASILSPVVCFDVAEDLDVCALGLTNGDICLYRGDLLYARYLRPQLLPRDGAGTKPVNFLGLAKGQGTGSHALFAVYEDGIGVWRLPAKAAVVYEQLAEFGAPPDCACLCEDPIAGDLAVARGDGVIFFAQDIAGQGACWAFEGLKRKVSCFRSNVVVVTEEVPEVPSGPRRVISSNAKGGELRRTFNVTIYDARNKFKVFSGGQRATDATLFPNIAHVLSDGAAIFVITQEGGEAGAVRQQLWRLKEKDTQTKLEMFFKKQMYKEAINLAKAQLFDAASIAEIMRRYGDRLCSEGKYDEAVEQYVHAIPEGEPSAVIWKLLDAQRIPNLRRYLEALHAKQAATPDHTTLLLNCYTKLNDLPALDRFVRQPTVQFDADTAIRVCRQAGYYDKALLLAERNKDHDTCLKIQLEDLQQYAAALALLRTLPVEEAEVHLQRYGRTLVRHLPEETTQAIMDICTHWGGGAPSPRPTSPLPISPTAPAAHPSPVASPRPTPRTHSAPELFQGCFVDAPASLMKFLEFVLSRGEAPLQASPALWNTLLELYLAGPAEGAERDRLRQKALQLLRDPRAKYDPVHALMLCQLHHFQDGTFHLYGSKLGALYEGDEAAAQQQLYADLLHQCIQAKDSAGILRLCKARGKASPNVWLQALQYFVDAPDAAHEAEIQEVLRFIDQEQLLPPLAVVRILAASPKATLAAVRDLVIRRLRDDLRGIAADERQIEDYSRDTQERRAVVQELQGAPVIVQTNKCAHCHSALVIPATHFLCKHSFHDHCLKEAAEPEDCPLCQPEVRKMAGIVASLAEGRDNHNAFFAHLRDSGDRFGTIADYFGRDVFNGRYPNPPDWLDSGSDSD